MDISNIGDPVAGIAQQFGHSHHVMAPQAAQDPGIYRGGTEHDLSSIIPSHYNNANISAGGRLMGQVRPIKLDAISRYLIVSREILKITTEVITKPKV